MSDFPDFDGTQHCAQPGVDAEQFHPRPGNNGSTLKTARDLCLGNDDKPPCPFLAGCREYAVHRKVSGIWGGTTEYERRVERGDRHIVPEPLLFIGISGRPIVTDVVRVHGNHTGVTQHKTAHEPICDECREFRNRHRREQRAKGKAS